MNVIELRPLPTQPLISVVMPVRNGERFVGEAVRSLQAQTYTRWELIVVDSSEDRTPEIIAQLAAQDGRIRLLDEPPGSIGRACNAALKLARGELTARMDADDVSLPVRFAVQLEWMAKTGVAVCGTWAKRFGDSEGYLWFPQRHLDIAHELLFGYALLQPSLLTHTELLRRHPYSEQATFEGHELFTRLAPSYRLGTVPAVLVKTRSHPGEAHRVGRDGCMADVRKARPPLLRALYPDADEEDAAAIAAVAEGRPLDSQEALARAGRWLEYFMQSPDNHHRQRMARRWREAVAGSPRLMENRRASAARTPARPGTAPATETSSG